MALNDAEAQQTLIKGGALDFTTLNLIQAALELAPILHDNSTARIRQHLPHLFLLALLIAPRIPNRLNLCSICSSRTTLAILYGHTLLCRLPQHLNSMQIDRWIRLAGRLRQARRSTEHMLARKVLILSHLINTSLHSSKSTGADNRQMVFPMFLQLLQLGIHALTRSQLLLQLRNNFVFFLGDVFLEFFVRHLVLIFGFQGDHHAAEVLPDELGEELRPCVAIGDVPRCQDLVCELSAGFEGELFGEDERVIAIEEKGSNLLGCQYEAQRREVSVEECEKGRKALTRGILTTWLKDELKSFEVKICWDLTRDGTPNDRLLN
jgi:hypothetical protein